MKKMILALALAAAAAVSLGAVMAEETETPSAASGCAFILLCVYQ